MSVLYCFWMHAAKKHEMTVEFRRYRTSSFSSLYDLGINGPLLVAMGVGTHIPHEIKSLHVLKFLFTFLKRFSGRMDVVYEDRSFFVPAALCLDKKQKRRAVRYIYLYFFAHSNCAAFVSWARTRNPRPYDKSRELYRLGYALTGSLWTQ